MSLLKREVNKYLVTIRHGDMGAFKKLFYLTSQHLLVIARNNLINKNYAEEVLDDVFMKILQYIKSFDMEKDGYNWMCKITENVAKTYNHKYTRNVIDIEKINATAKDDLENVELSGDIERAAKNLDPISKKILYYYFYRGYSYTKIARILKCHRTNISYHIKKIKKELKKYFSE